MCTVRILPLNPESHVDSGHRQRASVCSVPMISSFIIEIYIGLCPISGTELLKSLESLIFCMLMNNFWMAAKDGD